MASANKKSAIRVLHVDDDSSMLEISKQILIDMGSFEIDQACCVDEAFKKLSTGHYDVVVSDYEMPQKNGLEFLKEMRDQKNEIPFILFTGKGREEVAVKALNLGADGYINKQGNPETVYGELKHVILNSFEKRIAQEMLWQSEERFKKLVTNSKDLIMLTQADGIVLFLSPACKNVLGYEPSELIGKIPWIYHPDDLERVQKVFQSALTSKLSETLEYRILTKQGETKWVNHAFSQLWENGELKQIVSNLTDITERKKAEEAITQSESHYRLLADNVHDVIWTMDLEGHFTYVSPSVLQLRGYTPDEVLQQSMVEVLTPDSARIVLEDLQRFWETGAVPSNYYELEQFCKDGSTVWTEVNFTVLRNRDGKPEAFLGVSRNIAERKKAEEVVRKSEAKYRELANSLPEIVFETDLTGKITFFSQRSLEVAGFSREELEKGLNLLSFVVPEERERALENMKKSLAGEEHGANEYTLLRKNGTTYPAIVRTDSIISENKVTGLRGIALDITDRRKAEKTLLETEAKFRVYVENSPVAIFVANTEGKYEYVNEAASKLLGYSKEELLEISIPQVSFKQNNQIDLKRFVEVKETGRSVGENVLRSKDGLPVYVILNSVKLPDGKLLAFCENITERKKAEKEIQSLAKFPNENPFAVFRIDKNGVLLFANSRSQRLLDSLKIRVGQPMPERWGKTAVEALESKCQLLIEEEVTECLFSFSVIPIVSEGYVNVYGSDITENKKAESELKREREALQESEERFRTIFEGASEGILAADIKTKRFVMANSAMCKLVGYPLKELCMLGIEDIHRKEDLPYVVDEFTKQTEGKKVLASDIPVLRKDGKVVYCDVNSKVSSFGKDEYLVGFFRDTSERKKTEEKLRESIHNNELICEKLRVVGGLTRHDVGNKLMAAKSNLYLLKKQLGDRPELAKYVDGIESAFAGSDRIFEYSRLYEKIGVEEPSKVNVAECFNQAAVLFTNLGDVKVVNECHGLDVMADSLLTQLIYNLIDNSFKHGGKVTQIRLHYNKDAEWVKMFYEDDGVGIPEANKPKIFKEGFTTGKGTGFGLPLVKNMIEVYGWSITEEGEPGKGAKFTITIPKSNKSGKENYQTA